MYKNCLTRQINELESLQAMYCGPNELTLWNESEFENLKLTIQGKSRVQADDLPQIAFQLQLPLDAPHPADASLVFRVSMPAFYPSSDSVEVHISLDSLTPQQEKDLRGATNKYIETKLGQECILDLVQFAKEWVYDNATPIALPSKKIVPQQKTAIISPSPVVPSPIITTPTPVSTILTLPPTPISASNSSNNKPCTPSPAPVASAKKPAPAPQKVKAAPKGKSTPQAPKEQEFRRILIWFSTIAPDRAKTIAEWAKQLGLTGVSRLGSPALIVVEGQKEDVDEYVSSLRSYRWKKMEIVWEDKLKSTNTNALRRFTNFQECMMTLPDLQVVFKKAGLEDMYKEGLKIRG